METMRYKPLDKVRIKSLDWYNENKDNNREIKFENGVFTTLKSTFLGQIMTIEEITLEKQYILMEDRYKTLWTDEMIEGLVEEDVNLDVVVKETTKDISDKVVDTLMGGLMVGKSFNLPEGYQFIDENGNIINATKIVLEKKKKEYPKTYKECCKVMNYCCNPTAVKTTHKEELIRKFQFLLLYRDAYWKIAGEEMGLGKPWEPDWTNQELLKYCIANVGGQIKTSERYIVNTILAFPTEEMRDAFKENFDPDIEFCKEFL